ncbi:hypothetical protein [Nonomuraea jiangxiensis]|uniref:Lipoprotein LprG n=1 Tax=Nonomuraea jiangxiensis TaxID=633440 RepID=A0A1G8FWX0_9ACTN|nr:hypothetical protein [Nonomuraea jiangxiensis]SDH86649.1 hypothetical protein SAMN05421869_103458 [Nonomuraea jiangxiensis]
MKRILTGVALATTAALVTATPALAAAPKDPVVAVKKQLVPGKGVKFTERITQIAGRSREIVTRSSGTLQFSKTGLAASDISGKFNFPATDQDEIPEGELGDMLKAITAPERTIRIGTTSYLSGGIWASMLPEGKTWFKAPNGPPAGITGVFGQPFNVAEVATLKTLLKGAKPVSGGYAGKIKRGDAWKASRWMRASLPVKPSAKEAKGVISWRLTVNSAGLPTRLVSTFSLGDDVSVSVDTRYTDWGSSVSIKPPAVGDTSRVFSDGSDEVPPLDTPLLGLGD